MTYEKVQAIGELKEEWKIFETQEYVEYDSPNPGLVKREQIANHVYQANSEQQAQQTLEHIQSKRMKEGWEKTSPNRLEKDCDSVYGNLELNYRIIEKPERKIRSLENWEL